MNTEQLLKDIQAEVGCTYLSDLHSGAFDKKIKNYVKSIPPDTYSLNEWLNAIMYITQLPCNCKDILTAKTMLTSTWKR